MPRCSSMVVVLVPAAGILFPAFSTAIAADIAAAPTGVTIPKGYRDWQVIAPSKGHDFVFTRYAP